MLKRVATLGVLLKKRHMLASLIILKPSAEGPAQPKYEPAGR
jgi:hypothetical protein